MTHRHLLTLADVPVGSIVQLDLGVVRVCPRWCLLLDSDLREIDDRQKVHVAKHTRVLAVLRDQKSYVGGTDVETDPLRGRL